MNKYENNTKFEYSYSAKEQEEIRKIREKYLPPEENKLDRLRRLDAKATRAGMIAAIIVGTIGTLLFGLGMTCCMEWADRLFVPGIIIGVIGIFLMGTAHPIYVKITKKEREKIAPEILRLTDELEDK